MRREGNIRINVENIVEGSQHVLRNGFEKIINILQLKLGLMFYLKFNQIILFNSMKCNATMINV